VVQAACGLVSLPLSIAHFDHPVYTPILFHPAQTGLFTISTLS
jgi:hypothetical protein